MLSKFYAALFSVLVSFSIEASASKRSLEDNQENLLPQKKGELDVVNAVPEQVKLKFLKWTIDYNIFNATSYDIATYGEEGIEEDYGQKYKIGILENIIAYNRQNNVIFKSGCFHDLSNQRYKKWQKEMSLLTDGQVFLSILSEAPELFLHPDKRIQRDEFPYSDVFDCETGRFLAWAPHAKEYDLVTAAYLRDYVKDNGKIALTRINNCFNSIFHDGFNKFIRLGATDKLLCKYLCYYTNMWIEERIDYPTVVKNRDAFNKLSYFEQDKATQELRLVFGMIEGVVPDVESIIWQLYFSLREQSRPKEETVLIGY